MYFSLKWLRNMRISLNIRSNFNVPSHQCCRGFSLFLCIIYSLVIAFSQPQSFRPQPENSTYLFCGELRVYKRWQFATCLKDSSEILEPQCYHRTGTMSLIWAAEKIFNFLLKYKYGSALYQRCKFVTDFR